MDPTPSLQETPPGPAAPAMSLGARLLNIFATPGEVYGEMKKSRPATANWLVPVLINGVLGAIASFLILSQPALFQQVRAQQTKPIEAKVAAGKMTQADADKAVEQLEKYSSPALMKAFGAVGAVIMPFISVFWWALIFWLIGRFGLRGPVRFMKMAEVSGLAAMISALEVVIKGLLILGLNNAMASPSLALLLKDQDPQSKAFMVMSLFNVMTIWRLALGSIGLAKLADAPPGRAAVWVFGSWGALMALLVGVSLAIQKAMGGMGS